MMTCFSSSLIELNKGPIKSLFKLHRLRILYSLELEPLRDVLRNTTRTHAGVGHVSPFPLWLELEKTVMLTPATTRSVTCIITLSFFYSLLISMSLILMWTPRLTSLAAAAFSHRTPTLHCSLTHSLLAPASSRAPPALCSSLRPCAASPAPSRSARRRQAKPRPVLLVLDGGGAHTLLAPTLVSGIDRLRPTALLCYKCMFEVFQVSEVHCNCYIWMFQK
jgi:hypothetical protein